MMNATTPPLDMDEQGFLTMLDELIGRFGGSDSDRCSETIGMPRREYGLKVPCFLFDDEVHRLAVELFGGTSWPANLDADMFAFEERRIGYDAEFLIGCRNVVRRYGMGVWLYDMVNDASIAVALNRPSSRMPFCLGPFDTRETFRRDMRAGGKYVADEKTRRACMAEYLRQIYRLAAYSLLRWGGADPRAADIAQMMLAYGGLGMTMLRDDPNVVKLGCEPDFWYRNVCGHLRDMWIKADLDYACDIDLDAGRALEYPECMDARYLYDARKLIAAYRSLWKGRTEPAARVLERIEESGPYRVPDVWKDPLYLHDLSISLMGQDGACVLDEGFRTRDRDLFDRGVGELERRMREVGRSGLLSALAARIAPAAYGDRMDMPPAPREDRGRMLERCGDPCETAATIALYRLPRDRRSLRAVRALLMRETDAYSRHMGCFMDKTSGPEDTMGESVPVME